MAIFEWRKFNFFDLKPNSDYGNISEVTGEAEVSCGTSGRGQYIICDANGYVHVFYRNWNEVISFKGHEFPITLCALSTQNNLLITISCDEIGESPIFKVWNLSKINKDNGAPCLRTVKLAIQKPTALGVTENGHTMAIGFDRGGISLYRGDIGRDMKSNYQMLSNGTTPITGIKFKQNGKHIYMFVASDSGILVYNIQSKSKETKIILDKECASRKCCAIENNNNILDVHFMVGRDDAIYCYTIDGRGPCYALEGEKSIIEWFRNNLITVYRQTKSIMSAKKEYILTVIDIQNKFIVYTAPIDSVSVIFIEFGNCFVLTKNKKLFHLVEKDLQSKLNLLFKKNLYDIAIRIAKNQQYDAESLAGIFKQYGDHLYTKGSYSGAIEQYNKTIGYLEPSYVIIKFLDSRHIHYLTEYLQIIHKNGYADADHTTLLLNCYTRLGLTDKFQEFLSTDENTKIKFDVDVAIKISRNVSTDLALSLAKLNGKQSEYISIMIDMKAYEETVTFISKLPINIAANTIQEYGMILMQHCPQQFTELLKSICSKPQDRINPENVIKLFLNSSENLIDFLEHILKNSNIKVSYAIFNTLIELYLKKWESNESYSNRILEILKFYSNEYDKSHLLLLCKMYDFAPGTLLIYEEKNLYHLIVRHHLKTRSYDELLECCQKLGKNQPGLWLQALTSLRSDSTAPPELLLQVLNYIVSEKLQSPLQVLGCLAVQNGPQFSHVREYFHQVFKKEADSVKQDGTIFKDLYDKLNILQNQIENIRSKPMEFRSNTCNSCQQPLTMPAVFFLCQHSYHQDCIRTYSDNEKECSICHSANIEIMDALKKNSEPNQDETFHNLLNRSNDKFSVVASYFEKGLFNKLKVVLDEHNEAIEDKKILNDTIPIPKKYGPGAEAKLRLTEGYDRNASNYQTLISEGRMRADEIPKIKAIENLKAQSKNIKKIKNDSTFQNLANKSKLSTNPFEQSAYYDETKDPFAVKTEEVKIKKSGNPFEDEGYDSNLNPVD